MRPQLLLTILRTVLALSPPPYAPPPPTWHINGEALGWVAADVTAPASANQLVYERSWFDSLTDASMREHIIGPSVFELGLEPFDEVRHHASLFCLLPPLMFYLCLLEPMHLYYVVLLNAKL
jgi:hypothetical protein